MSNSPLDQRLAFDAEMSISAPFTGTSQLLGILQNNPVILLVKNQSTVSAFFADNPGSVNGTTMAAGEEFVLDCRSNKGNACNMGFGAGVGFYVTGTAVTGVFKVSILYAR
jgi:hypothetical protein